MRTVPTPAMPKAPFPGAVLVETHAHTAEVSPCGNLSAEELVALVAAHGYGALAITDHNVPGRTVTPERCKSFARGYRLAKEAAKAHGIAVLPGMELRFDSEGYNDFLVYLPDEELYERLPDLPAMRPRDFRRLADTLGLLIYQAHPYRPGLNPLPPECLHGIEVHNGNPHHDSCNHRALAYAEKHGLAMIAGSDLHEAYGARRGGLWAPPEAVVTPRAFVDFLRANPRPELFCPREAK